MLHPALVTQKSKCTAWLEWNSSRKRGAFWSPHRIVKWTLFWRNKSQKLARETCSLKKKLDEGPFLKTCPALLCSSTPVTQHVHNSPIDQPTDKLSDRPTNRLVDLPTYRPNFWVNLLDYLCYKDLIKSTGGRGDPKGDLMNIADDETNLSRF